MTGRPKDKDLIEEQLVEVIGKITDDLTMTWDDLFDVAVQFCHKNFEYYITVAREKKVVPAALILAALLYVEHPLIIAPGRGIKYGFLRATAEIMKAELLETDLVIPVRVSSTVSVSTPVE
jgi:hypothetical protein